VVTHCDICSSFPLEEMYNFHKSHGKLCTIMSVRVSREESLNYGNFVKDPTTNELIHHAEKPESFVSDLINCGVYIFSRDIVDLLTEAKERKSKQNFAKFPDHKIPKMKFLFKLSNLNEDSLTIEYDILNSIAGKERAYVYEIDVTKNNHFWFQIKTPSDVLRSTFHYLHYYHLSDMTIFHKNGDKKELQPKNVLVNSSADIHPTANIGPNVSIGAGVKIGAGVRIANSIILDGVEIYPHTYIMYSIIGWNSIIGSWCRIEGTANEEATSKGLESICILGVGVTVEPEIHIRNCVVLPYKNLSENHDNETIL